MEQQPLLYAAHGFLGQKTDWDIINSSLLPIKKWISLDLYEVSSPLLGFENWAYCLNNLVQKGTGPRILLGYSLGGRLALHTLLQEPHNWDGCIFISTHAGLEYTHEQAHRLVEDYSWSERFKSESWNTLMADWNSRQAFNDTTEVKRYEKHYSRQLLSDTLKCWSLGKQSFLWPKLVQLKTPILWIVGENDKPYTLPINSIQWEQPKSKTTIISRAGHRLIWDQPEQLTKHIFNFITTL